MKHFISLVTILVSTVFAHAGGIDQRARIAPFLGGSLPSSTPRTDIDAQISWQAVNAFPDLELPVYNPMHLLPVPQSADLLLMGDQSGRLLSFPNDPTVIEPTLILDLEPVTQYYGDSGLMGLVFHPDYGRPDSANNFIYILYRFRPQEFLEGRWDGESSYDPAYVRVSRFEWVPGSAQIDPTSEQVLINQYDAHNWHQGGGMAFGEDGFLYIALGDEGSENDFYNVAQKMDGGLFAGVLRIDVDKDPTKSHPIRRQPTTERLQPAGWNEITYTDNYFIPNDNPWLDPEGSILEEFYAIGLRNPYRMTRDPLTNQFWIGDVGQGEREEIDILEKGANYQWPFKEGSVIGEKPKPTGNNLFGTEVGPVFEYGREVGGCIVGGYVYRGTLNPELYGKYIFAEFNLGKLLVLDEDPTTGAIIEKQLLSLAPYLMLGFGIDQQGEIYITKRAEGEGAPPAQFLRIQKTQAAPNSTPTLLSQTNAFSDLETLTPATGVVPYDVVQPLWSDGADKKRWLSVPYGPDVSTDQISFSEQGNWTFPTGTVLIKHFGFGDIKVETRFTVKGDDGEWYGLSYRWNEDQTDAQLLTETNGVEADIEIDGVSKKWYFPSRTECFSCHTNAKGKVLGVKTRHLNRNLTYTTSGQPSNQLVSLNDVGYFEANLDNSSFENMLTAANVSDTSETMERRVRSYLDINCSHCHTEGSIPRARIETDLATPLFWQNLINAEPVGNLGIPQAKVVSPGDENLSILYRRASSLEGCCAMPPLAKNEVDTVAISTLRDWIRGLNPLEGPQNDVDPTAAPSDNLAPKGSVQMTVNENELLLEFPEPIEGIELSEIEIVNGAIVEMNGAGTNWNLTISPLAETVVDLTIPFDTFHDSNGNSNNEPVSFQFLANTKSGLNYTYYEGEFSILPNFTSLQPLAFGSTPSLSLAPRLRDDYFAMEFSGLIRIETPGDYQFHLSSDDGSRLNIGNTTVVNHDGLHGNTTQSGTVTLSSGTFDFAVAYFESLGNEFLSLEVEGPGIPRQPIPLEWLSSEIAANPIPSTAIQSINTAALPGSISIGSSEITIQVSVSSNVVGDLVVDIGSSTQWFGGERVRISPGTNLVELSIPLINQPAPGEQLFWNIFITEPGGSYQEATLTEDVIPVIAEEEETMTPEIDELRVLAAPTNLSPDSSIAVNVGYTAVTDGYIQLTLVGEDGRWIDGGSQAVSSGTGVKIFALNIPEGDNGPVTYHSFLSTEPWDWESARLWGTPVEATISSNPNSSFAISPQKINLTQSEPLRLSYSFTTDSPQEIALDIFDSQSDTLVKSTRIPIAAGTDTSSTLIDLSGLPPNEYVVNSFMVAPGGQWFDAIAYSDSFTFVIEAETPSILTDGSLFYPQTWTPQTGTEISVDREAQVRLPATPTESMPVVILLHRSGSSPLEMFNLYNFIDDHILIACQGYQKDWNISFDAHQAPDVAFIKRLIEEVRTFENVDSEDITILGWSNGSGLLNRLMIELDADMFKNAIGVASQLRTIQYNQDMFWYDPNGRWDYSVPTVPAPGRRILNIHGDNDQVVPYEAGDLWISNVESIYAWAQAMGYEGPIIDETTATQGPQVNTFSYLSGQVVHHRLLNGDHRLSVPGDGMTKTQQLILDFLSPQVFNRSRAPRMVTNRKE